MRSCSRSSSFFNVLTRLTGSPLAALGVILVIWWMSDRATYRLLPDPLRAVTRLRRRWALEGTLRVNPHYRRARFELAELLLGARRPARAAEVLRPNVEAGDEDAHTAFAMGAALGRSGNFDAAERALEVARAADPRFRAGEIDLELGRLRVARGDFAGRSRRWSGSWWSGPARWRGATGWPARGSAPAMPRRRAGCATRPGASTRRSRAFHRRHERSFAWRANPSRPAAVGLALAVGVAIAASMVCRSPGAF